MIKLNTTKQDLINKISWIFSNTPVDSGFMQKSIFMEAVEDYLDKLIIHDDPVSKEDLEQWRDNVR